MSDITILYYTANRENPLFEKKIRDTILKNKGNLSVVSVSQDPIDFGYNICVGRHEASYYNLFKQVYIGLMEINTSYVLITESDFLYPPDYFNFIPAEEGRYYRYRNVWVIFNNGGGFSRKPLAFYKGYSDGAQLVSKDLYISLLKRAYQDNIEWDRKEGPGGMDYDLPTLNEYSWNGSPVVNFKTENDMVRRTPVYRRNYLATLPYWGNVDQLKRVMFDEK